MSWTDKRAEYETFARGVDPAVTLSTKDSWAWRLVAWLLTVFTFGGIKPRVFLEQYATTFGPLQAYPKEWAQLYETTITHEGQHTKQCKWFGWLVPIVGWLPGRVGHRLRAWAGLPIMGLLYLLVVLPLGLAVFRWLFEINAEVAAMRYRAKRGDTLDSMLERAQDFGEAVCGKHYGWAWPRWLGGVRAFERAARRAHRSAS